MTDYTYGTGNGGVMTIRDDGTNITLIIKAGSTSTHVEPLYWSLDIDGTNVGGSVNYPSGAPALTLASFAVGSSQTVVFRIGATGTSGLGGPTNFSQYINRLTPPPPPTPIVIAALHVNSIDTQFTDDFGHSEDKFAVGYGTDPSAPQTSFETSTGTNTVSGLTSGVTYYFWTAAHNAAGWSSWSARSQGTTLRIPDAPNAISVSTIRFTSVVTAFTGNGDGGSPITRFEIGYGTNATTPQTIFTAGLPGYNGVNTISGLTPGTTYYFWARAVNAVGNSAWGGRGSARTTAGARINVGGVYKDAIPFVNVAGVWKMAEPRINVGGTWKITG